MVRRPRPASASTTKPGKVEAHDVAGRHLGMFSSQAPAVITAIVEACREWLKPKSSSRAPHPKSRFKKHSKTARSANPDARGAGDECGSFSAPTPADGFLFRPGRRLLAYRPRSPVIPLAVVVITLIIVFAIELFWILRR